MTKSLFESHITSLPLINKGKVRDLYDIDEQHLLIVTTDRVSAFDVILPTPIPGKGKILTDTALFWMHKATQILPNQLSDDLTLGSLLTPDELSEIDGRGMIVKKLKPLPVEAIVRGYLVGSGWKEYQSKGTVCNLPIPESLQLAAQLPEPIFTPSTKAAVGDHDENISFEQVVELIGADKAQKIKDYSLQLYKMAAEYALERGIIIADTKFEFGEDEQGVIHLIDEALTPDSSRFWRAKTYQVGQNPESFDKQYIRDYLDSLDWDKNTPPPELPQEVVEMTLQKYQEAKARLMDNS